MLNKVNQLIEEMFRTKPLVEYNDNIKPVSEKDKFILARMYAEDDYRSFLEREINLNVKAAVMKIDDPNIALVAKGRIIAYKELLIAGKYYFDHFERLRKANLNEHAPDKIEK